MDARGVLGVGRDGVLGQQCSQVERLGYICFTFLIVRANLMPFREEITYNRNVSKAASANTWAYAP